jgi:hypothetical protein
VLVEHFELEGPEELLATLLPKQPLVLPMEHNRPAARSRRPNAQDVYCDPSSEWATVRSAGGCRGFALADQASEANAGRVEVPFDVKPRRPEFQSVGGPGGSGLRCQWRTSSQ